MTKAQVEVITSVQRRRRWSRAEKERIVAAAIEPGAVASEVARAAGIHTSQLFRWRHQLCGPAPAALTFAPVAIAPDAGAISTPVAAGVIEIEFATGTRMRISGPADASTVRAMVTALAQAKRRRPMFSLTIFATDGPSATATWNVRTLPPRSTKPTIARFPAGPALRPLVGGGRYLLRGRGPSVLP